MTVRRRTKSVHGAPRTPRGPNPLSATYCKTLLQRLSDYLDDDLPTDVCQQIRVHLGACPNCERFAATLRQSILLCRHAAPTALSEPEKDSLHQTILRKSR